MPDQIIQGNEFVVLTKEQHDALVAAGQISDANFYITPRDDTGFSVGNANFIVMDRDPTDQEADAMPENTLVFVYVEE